MCASAILRVPGNSASNVWFTCFATSPTALILCFQNTSLVLGVQAFRGGALCGSLTRLAVHWPTDPVAVINFHYRVYFPVNYITSERLAVRTLCRSDQGYFVFAGLPVLASLTYFH